MDGFKQDMEKLLNGHISDYDYFSTINDLSGEFGVPVEAAKEMKEYWLTKDDGALSEKTKEFLRRCVGAFALSVKRDGKEGE